MAGRLSSLIKIIFLSLLISPVANADYLGLYYGKMGGYFKIGTFTELGLHGPKEAVVTKHPYSSFYKLSKPTKVCLKQDELKRYFPEDFPPNELESYLPVMHGTAVVPGSMKRIESSICYSVQERTQFFNKEEANKITEASKSFFEGYEGINVLPKEVQDRLKKLWNRPGSLEQKIERIENFWEREIQYVLNDDIYYKRYFEFFPNHNFLQASLRLKKGDCYPKNFGLAVSIHQLSGGKVPVRMNYAIWLRSSDKEIKEIDFDRLHLHVEYLTKDKKRRFLWKTAESSLNR